MPKHGGRVIGIGTGKHQKYFFLIKLLHELPELGTGDGGNGDPEQLLQQLIAQGKGALGMLLLPANQQFGVAKGTQVGLQLGQGVVFAILGQEELPPVTACSRTYGRTPVGSAVI